MASCSHTGSGEKDAWGRPPRSRVEGFLLFVEVVSARCFRLSQMADLCVTFDDLSGFCLREQFGEGPGSLVFEDQGWIPL